MVSYFLDRCEKKGLNLEYLFWVTKSLIFGTFHSIPPDISKNDVWALVKEFKT